MIDFNFHAPTEFEFGKNSLDRLATLIKKYKGTKVLFHYGQNSIKKIGLYDKVVKGLNDNNIEFVELSGVSPNPRIDLVRKGIEFSRENNVDFILAVGGGSVIDSAKGIALGVNYKGDVWDFYDRSKKVRTKDTLPIGTILTIPAAGSEGSPATVISNEETNEKNGFLDDSLRPKFSIINPEMGFTLPKYHIACGVTDMLGHCIERYFVPIQNVEFTDRLLEATMKIIIEFGAKTYDDPKSYDNWSQVFWAGTIAHNDILNTGRTRGDWASHIIEHQISARYDIAHGAGLALTYPAWMKYVSRSDEDRFVQFFQNVFDIKGLDNKATINKGIEELEKFYRGLGLKIRYGEHNFKPEDMVLMAKAAVRHGEIGSYKRLNEKDVLEIFKLMDEN